MKIAFICGSIEPGHDGVGDYTRRLAGALIRYGHQVKAIAINDYHVKKITEGTLIADGTEVNVCRIPSVMPAHERFNYLEQQIAEFTPEWISLQFVPFSFDNRGLSARLAFQLNKAGKGYEWHIMFHELWVGVDGKAKLKHKLLGKLQKALIYQLVRQLKPLCVTTSISLYKNSLNNISVNVLPLFSNIPLIAKGNTDDDDTNDSLTVVHFGTFTSAVNELSAQVNYIKKIATVAGKTVRFVSMGEGGGGKLTALGIVKETFGAENTIEKGRMTDNDIALQLLNADIGISRADISMFGKSGSTLAMLEYGLPVLLRGTATRDQVAAIENSFYQDQIFFPDSKQLTLPSRKPPKSNLENIASMFTGFLSVACG